MDGILNVYKPSGMTSFAVVSRVKRFCGTKRIGHAGTLDPMATGVLPLLVGKTAVMQEKLSDHDKAYVAGIRFGIATDTGDITGKIVSQAEVKVSEKELSESLEKFVGKIKQVPPMYSAIQIDGRRLYDLARKGIEVERKERDIEIYSLKLVEAQGKNDFVIDVKCSKGTYIRTLCEDIGKSLGVPATMYSLERTECGVFKKEDSLELDTLEKLFVEGKSEEIEKLLMPAEPFFKELPIVKLSEFFTRLCLNGCEIYLKKLNISEDAFCENAECRVYGCDGAFIGVGFVKNFEEGKAIKLKYRFV